jgi:uncharacterized protein (TIGR02453 family)
MSYFSNKTLTFLRGLNRNNSKAWFDEHRAEYQQHLREPYLALAEDLCEAVGLGEPEYELDPKRAIYRINRDIRFSNDKTPYKTNLGITVGRREKHDPSWPAYTARIGLDGIAIGGGLYMPEPPLRDQVRRWLATNPEAGPSVLANSHYRTYFGEISGERNKRLPKDLTDLALNEPLVYHKQWLFWAEWPDAKLLLDPDLDQFIMERWQAGRVLNDVLKRAVTR